MVARRPGWWTSRERERRQQQQQPQQRRRLGHFATACCGGCPLLPRHAQRAPLGLRCRTWTLELELELTTLQLLLAHFALLENLLEGQGARFLSLLQTTFSHVLVACPLAASFLSRPFIAGVRGAMWMCSCREQSGGAGAAPGGAVRYGTGVGKGLECRLGSQ